MASQDSNIPKATYRQLGKSGLRVSNPILGAMSIGDKRWAPWVIEEDEALPLLKAAYDRGINTWDTANVYPNGVSEEIIAKAIKKYAIPRHKLVIATKCCGTVRESNDPETLALQGVDKTVDYVNQRGLSRQGIFNAVNASLKRLETDYVDLLQIHRYDATVPIEETMKALHDLVEAGKVRYIGASSMWAVQFAAMQWCAEKHGWTKFVSMQGMYNLLYREEERYVRANPCKEWIADVRREMNRFCYDTGVGLIPVSHHCRGAPTTVLGANFERWGPLAQGALARPIEQHGSTTRSQGKGEHSETDAAIIKRVKQLADKKGWPMAHVALAWINDRISSPIIGFSSAKRMDEAIEANGKELTEEEEKYLEELYQAKAVAGFDTTLKRVSYTSPSLIVR
jgi:aryl-alcohol dehydrogenase-like predicted oxidoreductase